MLTGHCRTALSRTGLTHTARLKTNAPHASATCDLRYIPWYGRLAVPALSSCGCYSRTAGRPRPPWPRRHAHLRHLRSRARQLVERDVDCRQSRPLLVELALRLGDHGGRRLVREARPVEPLLELLDAVLQRLGLRAQRPGCELGLGLGLGLGLDGGVLACLPSRARSLSASMRSASGR